MTARLNAHARYHSATTYTADPAPVGYGGPSPSSCTHEGWTDERVALLEKLWIKGVSASGIAKQLGGVTRSAVIGKANRLGLPARKAGPAMARARKVRAAKTPMPAEPRPAALPLPSGLPATPRPGPLPLPPVPPAQTPPLQPMMRGWGVATLSLTQHTCRWPIGDPRSDEFVFCGRRAQGSYCAEHHEVAYRPDETEKSKAKAAAVQVEPEARRQRTVFGRRAA